MSCCVLYTVTHAVDLHCVNKMDNREFRVLIKHCFLMGRNTVDAKQWLDTYYGKSAPAKSTICTWYAEFKRGHLRTDDAPRSGRRNGAVNSETIRQVQRMILADCRARVREISDQVQISQGSTLTILHDHLMVKKLCAQWVPLELNTDQKKHRVIKSELGLKLFRHDKDEFLQRFITVNEIWIYHIKPENTDGSGSANGWETADSQPKQRQSDDKALATIFWDASGIIFIDYLKMGITKLTITQYNDILNRLDAELNVKRPQLSKQNVLFHCDTIPTSASSSIKIMTKLKELKYELLGHPQYSPDLDPSEFYLFPNLKGWLQGKRFATNTQLEMEINGYFDGFDNTYFTKGIEMIEERWSKCIELDGNYVDE